MTEQFNFTFQPASRLCYKPFKVRETSTTFVVANRLGETLSVVPKTPRYWAGFTAEQKLDKAIAANLRDEQQRAIAHHIVMLLNNTQRNSKGER